eukprot:m.144589 g.144589  ORF g.144589 m.144589 type:complete len:226 (+) comp38404_c0_seq7:48-725(+)
MNKLPVKLYYDVLSPYFWLGFETLCRYRDLWCLDLQFCPFRLGEIMTKTGVTPPGKIPAKALYYGRDLMRCAKFFNVPMKIPKNVEEVMFVKGSLAAQRLLTATNIYSPVWTEGLSRALWTRIWSKDEDVIEDESLIQACHSTGMTKEEAEDLVSKISTDPVKQEYKRVTEEGLAYGAFGAPTIVFFPEKDKPFMFWGSDRFELMAYVLGKTWHGPTPASGQDKC